MSRQSARLVWVVCLTLLLTCGPALPPVAPAGAIFPQSDGAAVSESAFLDVLARDTWTYLHSSQTTAHHLPYSWWSSSIPGGDYANPAEIGLYALAWLAACDLGRPWSPSWSETEAEVARFWTNCAPGRPVRKPTSLTAPTPTRTASFTSGTGFPGTHLWSGPTWAITTWCPR